MNSVRIKLIEVLRDAQVFLSRPENDFGWSSWGRQEDAVAELSALIAHLVYAVELPEKWRVTILFAATGPIQEVSISSGWGMEFLELASRFDSASEEVYGVGRSSGATATI